jgi:alkylation response protein AidB-like acyl-CoA dehydrogenase
MDFSYSPRTQELQAQLRRFMDEHIHPAEAAYAAEIEVNTKAGQRWTPLQTIEKACGTCSCPTASSAPASRTRTTRRWPK